MKYFWRCYDQNGNYLKFQSIIFCDFNNNLYETETDENGFCSIELDYGDVKVVNCKVYKEDCLFNENTYFWFDEDTSDTWAGVIGVLKRKQLAVNNVGGSIVFDLSDFTAKKSDNQTRKYNGIGFENHENITTKKAIGVVKFFNRTKNFGFITPHSGGNDIFFHGSNVYGSNPYDGDAVEYELFKGIKDMEACNVRKIY